MSAQSRDETTIEIAEELFKKYDTLQKISNVKYKDILKIFSKLNYNKTKSKNVINAAKIIINQYNSKVPNSVKELTKIPGVGRKTANLIITEVYKKDGICVDTHCHRISNIMNWVNTKNPNQTEYELKKIVPKKMWSKINRVLVLWGKECPRCNKKELLKKINYE